jgi:hypothetical protein
MLTQLIYIDNNNAPDRDNSDNDGDSAGVSVSGVSVSGGDRDSTYS